MKNIKSVFETPIIVIVTVMSHVKYQKEVCEQ